MSILGTHGPRPWVSGVGKGELIRFDGRRGQRVTSRRGSLWVTLDGDPDDVVLGPGEAHCLPGDGPVLIQALDAACVVIDPVERPAGWWARLRGFAPVPIALGSAA